MTLLVGAKGSMGQRYRCILKHLGEACVDADKEDTMADLVHLGHKSDRIIIATPTPTHWLLIRNLTKLGKPVMCEKPISIDMKEVEKICVDMHSGRGSGPLTMQMQYSELIDPESEGESEYNFFRHGSDGLYWDCLQIIALAKGPVYLAENSPIWRCKINGHRIKIEDMDSAYVKFVKKWIAGEITQTPQYIYDIHSKVERLLSEYRQRIN